MDLGLRGKTALVFGAAGGLGGAIAQGLAAEGARLVVADENAMTARSLTPPGFTGEGSNPAAPTCG